MKKTFLLIVTLLLSSLLLFFLNKNKQHVSVWQIDFSKRFLIAHGAGEIDGRTYTNSLEALQKSIQNQFQFIELDLIETTDGHILAAHDWRAFHLMTGFSKQTQPISSDEVKKRKIFRKYTPLLDTDIVAIFEKNPQLVLVTDKMNDFDLLERYFSSFKNRMIVEVFTIEKYKEALERGFLYPAFCVKRNESLLNEALQNHVSMITFDLRASKRFLQQIRQSGLILLGYTSNKPDFIKENSFINGIYTDRLIPSEKID